MFSSYVYLNIEQLMVLLPERNKDYFHKRLYTLYFGAYLDRVQRNMFDAHLYFLDRKGGDEAAHFGYLPESRWVQKKSPLSMEHDTTISWFHLKHEFALGAIGLELIWEQWRRDMKDMLPLEPDARFAVRGDERYSILEIVRANEHGIKKKEGDKPKPKNLSEKLADYMELDIERVCIVLPSHLRVTRYLEKLEGLYPAKEYPTQKIWLTDYQSFMVNTLDPIWKTPANYRTRQYSILKPGS